MAGGKETPRQRMIGILYLVLLGLIALNVPDSLLDAFKNITNSLDKSRENVSSSLKDTYSAFEKNKLKQEGERAEKIYKEAQEATRISGELDKYIEELKAQLIKEGGGINPEIDDVNARDNLDISPRIMITDKKADVLRDKINQTKEELMKLLGPDAKGVNFSLNTEDPKTKPGTPNKTWQEGYFGDGIPLGATLTTLAKIQADNKNAENEVVKKLLGKVDKAEINLDQFKAVVVAPSSYIIQGQPYTAEVFLTAYDKNAKPTIKIDGSPILVKDGRGQYTSTPGEGVHKFTAEIDMVGTDGKMKPYYSDPVSFTVARPSAVVSADKMNVLYIGVANPMSVSAPGVPTGSLKVSISGAGGSISGSGGHYTAMVKSPSNDVSVTVYGEKNQPLGTTKYRAKVLPPPVAAFVGETGGSTSAANLRAGEKLFAQMKDFDFELKYNITQFTLLVLRPRTDAFFKTTQGANLTPEMRTALSGVVPGSTVVFKGITALGPDGIPKKVPDLVLLAN